MKRAWRNEHERDCQAGAFERRGRRHPSKSAAHRLLIAAALSDAPTHIELPSRSRDIDATAGCLRALGADIQDESGGVWVSPVKKCQEAPLLDCGESGTTLRLLLPVAAALCKSARVIGRGRLPERRSRS